MTKTRRRLLLGLASVLALLLILVPPEKKLDWMIKPVLLHGAITWVSFILFMLFGAASLSYLFTGRQWLYETAARGFRVGLIFWVVNFLVWFPMGLLIWNSLFGEPRAKASVWVLLLLGIGYLLSQFIKNSRILAGIYALTSIGIVASFSGVRKVLHPLDPVGTSDSVEIKVFFLAISLVCLVIGLVLIKPARIS